MGAEMDVKSKDVLRPATGAVLMNEKERGEGNWVTE